MRVSPIAVTCLLLLSICFQALPGRTWAEEDGLRQTDVFVSGQGAYHTYRIPSVITTTSGTLLAFCEGRKQSRSDAGDIDLLWRRSLDGGQTWSDVQVIWDDAANTCGNPCPVVDQATGTIWLLLTWNAGHVAERDIQSGFGEDSRRVFVCHSTDDGVSWSQPKEITQTTKLASWSWYATGPGAGIQLQRSDHRGRLVIPCDHKTPTADGVRFESHVIYSDDGGQSWQLGGSSPEGDVNECEVVELSDGQLLLNMRNYDRQIPARQICISQDGGQTWRDQQHAPTLIEPICQASIRRLSWTQADAPGVLVFSNPANVRNRENLTIRASYDDGKTWPIARVLEPGSSAYSCLCVLPDGTIGCLYEQGDYQRLRFARFPLAWLTGQPATAK